jgi:hypothetical protein
MPYADTFAANGIVIVEYALAASDLDHLAVAFDRLGLMSPDLVAWLSAHPVLTTLAARLAGPTARLVAVQAIDAQPAANWFVPWRQERSIAVANRIAHPDYDQWTVKDASLQVEPPRAVLEGMDRAAIADVVADAARRLCLTARGDILCLRPLLLRRSQKGQASQRQRTLHLDYAATPLAPGLLWPLDVATIGAQARATH